MTPATRADSSTRAVPNSQDIAARAHELWEREGRPEGREVENWLAAEAELRKEAPGEKSRGVEDVEESVFRPRGRAR